MFKKVFFLSLIIFAMALTAFGQKGAAAAKTEKPDPAKDVRAAFDRLIDGIKQADAAKVMSVYENSPRILFFNNNGTATIGWDTMKANREASYAKIKNVSLEVTGVRVEMLGADAAYVTCKWSQQQENNGKVESASGRMTLIFKKIAKEWKAVHLHTSPDNPDLTRPVMPSERLN